MNLGQAKTKAIKLINEFSKRGVPIQTSQNLDYTLRMNDLANSAQMELAQAAKIPATHEITQNPIPSQLGLLTGFDLVQHTDIEYTMQAAGTKAYYFEVDNVATIYVEEEIAGVWTVLETISNTVKGKYTAYKNLIAASNAANMIRIRFSGNYPYNIRNRAMYAYAFPAVADIPAYRPYVRYTMPADFMEVKQVITETDPRVYKTVGQLFWEGKNVLVLNYYDKGSFLVQYFKYPTVITADTADSYEFEISLDAQEAIPYYLAGYVLLDDTNRTNIAVQLINEYELKLSRILNPDTFGITTIQNVTGW
jgi:hypothetical protein